MRHIAAQFTGLAALLASCLLGSSGCKTVGPDYKPPQTATPTNWTSELQAGLAGVAADTNLLERWWTVFNDPILSDLVERARAGNLDLRQAEARVREARAQRGMAKAGLFPAVGANASASRTTASKQAGSGQTTDFYATSLDASWELDLFGGKRRSLESAAREEEDHLAWSADRIAELGGRPSLLNPLWYAGSLAIGLAAGALGDRWNLAFLAETEHQVEEHLSGHLERLPQEDRRTRALVEAMRDDEAKHRRTAIGLGAAELPAPAKSAMRLAARVMTTLAYRI